MRLILGHAVLGLSVLVADVAWAQAVTHFVTIRRHLTVALTGPTKS